MKRRHVVMFLLGVAWIMFVVLFRIDTSPVMTCVAQPPATCVFRVKLEDFTADRICFREIGETDFLGCKDREAGLDILPITVQPPPPRSGAIVFEAITINTLRDPPLSSSPASTLGFIPDLASPDWQNSLKLLSKRIRLRWGNSAQADRPGSERVVEYAGEGAREARARVHAVPTW